MQKELKIEKARPEDAERWCEIRKACWLQVYPNEESAISREDILLKDFDSPDQIKGWQDSFVNPIGCKYYSAKIGRKVIGICIGYDHESINEIGAIYVDPEYHHQGIGRELIERAISGFEKKQRIKLNVVSYNQKAIEFYQKLGFRIIGPIKDDFGKLPNGKVLPEIEMIKNSFLVDQDKIGLRNFQRFD